jgi:hypothetical protein
MTRTPQEIRACLDEVTRLISAPPRALAHTLDNGCCTDPRCSSCSRRPR